MTKAANPTSVVLPAAGTNGLHDIKQPVDIPSGWTWVWWTLAALALAVLLVWAWRRWQKRRAQVPPVPVIPPHVRAKQKLQEALALIGRPREFCIVVSDTLRLYLEERFDFHAPERTTEEFLHELRGTRLLTPDQKESLGDFLRRCDLVKFARYEPGEPELRDLHASALRLVEETEPLPEEPGSDGGGSTTGPQDRGASPPAAVHSSQFTVHSSQFTVHGSRFTVHGSRFTVRRPPLGAWLGTCRWLAVHIQDFALE